MSKSVSLRSRVLIACLAGLVLVTACGGGQNLYQGLAPEEILETARVEFAEGNHRNAISALDRLLEAHSSWERIPEARIMLADVYFDRGDFLTARSEYTRFVDRYPAHAQAANAALGICRSLSALAPVPQRDQTYTQQAITSCRNVVIDFSGQEQSASAAQIANELRHTLAEKEFLNAEFYFRRKLYDAAIKYYEFVTNLYPESEFAPPALLGLMRCNEAIGYDDLADEARDRLLERYPDSDAAAQARGAESDDGYAGNG
jgi:outer membrane protein assembly factor BamD